MPIRANHSRVAIRHIREGVDDPATFGVVPAAPLLTSTIITTESFKANSGIKESELSKPNRLPGGTRETSLDGGGDVNVECLFCDEFDQFLEDGLCDLFQGYGAVSAIDISAAAVDNSISTLTAALFAGIAVGDRIEVTGFATAGNNGRFLVTGKPTGLKLLLAAAAPEGRALVNEAAGATVVIGGGSVVSAAISAASGDNSLNDASGLLFARIPLGAWIKMSGWATAGNNALAYVSAKPTPNKLVLSYIVLTTEAVGPTVTLAGRVLRDGTKLITRAFERHRTDFLSDPYQAYKGQYCESVELNFTFQEIWKAKFTYKGRGAEPPSASTIGTGAPVAGTPATYLLDISRNMTAFRTDGALDGNIKSLTITLTNNGELIMLAQTLYPDGVSMGTAALSGTLEGYLGDGSGRVLKAFSRLPDSYHFHMIDDLGRIYVFTIWRLLYDEKGDTAKSGKTGPAMLSLPWKAEEDPTIGHWIQVCRFA
jgi:hypothetical protein